MWSASPCQPKLSQLDPKFTYKHYSKIQMNLKRYQVNLLMQIRTGYIPLNFYLHQIKKAEMRNCTACQGHGPPTKETIMHFLFKCGTVNKEWHELDKQMGKDSRDLPTLLSSNKGVKALVSYINRMRCLHTTKREHLVSETMTDWHMDFIDIKHPCNSITHYRCGRVSWPACQLPHSQGF